VSIHALNQGNQRLHGIRG